MPICTQYKPTQRRYQMHDITMLINVLNQINIYGIWVPSQHTQWTMPNHVDEIDSTIRKAHTAWYARHTKIHPRHYRWNQIIKRRHFIFGHRNFWSIRKIILNSLFQVFAIIFSCQLKSKQTMPRSFLPIWAEDDRGMYVLRWKLF